MTARYHTSPTLAATLGSLLASSLAAGQALDPETIRDIRTASLRNNICPSPANVEAFDHIDQGPRSFPPARVFDNLYLLGTDSTVAWALTTSEGIILFDAMFHGNVEETVVDSLRELGLDPEDIEYVIISHAHNDHFGGAHYLQQEFGARIVMSVEDWDHMHTWPQLGSPAPFPLYDTAVRDGYSITLGDVTVDIVATPGHTPGTISPIFPVRDGEATHYVGYWGASAVSFLDPDGIVQYMGGADRFARIDPRVDVPLTNHPGIDGALLKLAALEERRSGEPHPFVEGNPAFRDWVDAIHDCAGEVLAEKLRSAD
ncbi:MAG TPA: MBL fold metallo-hydrolase [Gammaproteobacteria bacterium]|nr:MBL fold metallo-hydrolase [Gammaproteobacteria bacterium]